MNKSTSQTPIEIRLAHDQWFAYNTLIPVFRHLEIEDLLKVAQVCKLWNWIAFDDDLWRSMTLPTCEKHLPLMVDKFGDKLRSIEIDGLARATVRALAKNLRKLPYLRKATLSDCRLQKLTQILDILNPNLEALQIEQTHREVLESYSLEFVKKFPNLTFLGIMTFSTIELQTVEALKHLKKLKRLFLYDEYNNFPYEVFKDLTNLKILQLGGFTNDFLCRDPDFIYSILRYLPNLRKLKLEIYPICNYNFFYALKRLPNLIELELHGEIISRYDGSEFTKGLSQCINLKVLIIEMDPEFTAGRTIYDHAIRNSILEKAVLKLKKTLLRFHWLIPGYYVKTVKEVWGVENSIIFQKSRYYPKDSKDVTVMNVDKFKRKLEKAMSATKVLVLVQHYNYRYCPKCRHLTM